MNGAIGDRHKNLVVTALCHVARVIDLLALRTDPVVECTPLLLFNIILHYLPTPYTSLFVLQVI